MMSEEDRSAQLVEGLQARLRHAEEREEQWRLFSLATSNMLWNWDFSTNVVERNITFETAFGYLPYEVHSDISWWVDRLHDDDRGRVMGAFEAARDGGREGCAYEYRFRCKDGSFAQISDKCFLLRDAEGRAYGALGAMTDITTRTQAEAALRLSEERRQLAVFGSDLGTWDWNILTDEIVFDERWAGMLGYSLDEVEPSMATWEKLVHPDDLPSVMDSLRKHFDAEMSMQDVEFRMRAKSGEWKWILGRGKVVERASDGSPERMTGAHLDITSQRHAEEALRSSEENFQALFDSMREGVAVCDVICDEDGNPVDYRFLMTNPAFGVQTGMNHEACVGKTIREIYPDIEQDWIDRYGGVAITQEPNHWTDYNHNTGRYYDVAAFSPSKGRFAMLFRDVTEATRTQKALRESEERFRMIYENAPVLINAFDTDGRCILWNKECSKVFGWTMDEINAHADTLALFYPNPAVRDEVMRTVTTSPDEHFREWHPVTKDGQSLTTMWANFPLPDDMTFSIGYDITERTRMEEELRRNQNLESLGLLAGGIAHDFNNVLTGVIGNLALLESIVDKDSEAHDIAKAASRAADRTRDLTQQLLTFAKGGAPATAPASIEKLVRETTELSLHGSHTKSVYHLDENLSSVLIDQGQIAQVIQNLVLNADQAMSDGGMLHVFAENVEVSERDLLPLDAGDYVKISVVDEGAGMPPEVMARIFDPYFTTKPAGHGLGLSITHSIVQRHGGYIGVRSEQDVGTTFEIYLPALPEAAAAVPKQAHEVARGTGRILLMDDEEMIQTTVTRMLEQLGYEVEGVYDGVAALQAYQASLDEGNAYDLVIMDLTVPGAMGGQHAVANLLKIDPQARVIVSSGYADDPVMNHPGDYGFVGKIAKPVRLKDLAETVKMGCQHRKRDRHSNGVLFQDSA